ncbi:hypothetical protein HY639_01740 [Candidatus Woesearchaeota archaeon]|nr:hypothetical protein [Candidatus Woesearchaeota archaeon]
MAVVGDEMVSRYILLVIVALAFLIMGCEAPECTSVTDCSQKEHQKAACVDGKCTYSPIPKECGNGLCEKTAEESVCSCPEDCKTPKCEGKYKVEKPGQKPEDAKVLTLFCDDTTRKCTIGVKVQTPRQLREVERETAFGKMKIKVDYTEPMDLKKKDKFSVTLQLIELAQDVAPDRGLEVYQISFFSKDRLAEKRLNNVFLKELRQPRVFDIPLALQTVPGRELLASVTMRVDYGFTRHDKISATEFREVPKTGTIEYDLPDRVAFIESGELS